MQNNSKQNVKNFHGRIMYEIKKNKNYYRSMMEKEKRIVVEHFLPHLEFFLIFPLFIFVVVKNEKKNPHFFFKLP